MSSAQAARESSQDALARFHHVLRENHELAVQYEAATGQKIPETRLDWMIAAAEHGYPEFAKGELSERAIYAWVVGRAAAKRGEIRGASARTGSISYTVAALRDMTGLANKALNAYAKRAGVRTPRRGERNFRYAAGEVRTILETIIAATSECTVRDRCRTELRNLRKMAE